MNYIDLPPELVGLQGRVQFVQRINDNELHMSCPNCGTEPHHSDSNPSDRFVVWMESRLNGRPFGMCIRHCGFKWTPGKQDVEWTPEEKAAFTAKRRELNQRENERIQEYARNVVMKQAAYLKYADDFKSSAYAVKYMQARGFDSPEWNEWFKYGVIEAFRVNGRNGQYYSPAITMPIFGVGKFIENVKVRVADAHDPQDRFRNLYKSGNQHPYFPLQDETVANKVVIFEGEMKANQVVMRGGLPEDIQVQATQGKGMGARHIYMVENCEVVYLCLDPDAFVPNEKGDTGIMQNVRKIGYDRTRIIICKEKVDDAILGGFNLLNAFNMAVKPSQLGLGR
jgi:hypothetical protein